MRVNLLAVLVSGLAIFILGALWYSPLMFAKRWVALMGKSEEELKGGAATPLMFLAVFIYGLLTAFTLAVIINHFGRLTPLRGAMIGGFCWVGLTGATSFGSALFSMKPKELWLIDSGYNLVSFILAGIILAAWR